MPTETQLPKHPKEVLTSLVVRLRQEYPTVQVDDYNLDTNELGHTQGLVFLKDQVLHEIGLDIYPTDRYSPRSGNFASVKLTHDGRFYRADQQYFFGGIRVEQAKEVVYPRPIVMDIANLFAQLVEGRIKHYAPWGREFDTAKDPVHPAFKERYSRSEVTKRSQPFEKPEEVQEALLGNIVGYIQYLRSTAVLSRDKLT